jgi:two-component system sensor histidine kinase ChvG
MTSTLSARLDAIERFAADVSHEIKNPLTSIRSAVETLELSSANPDTQAAKTSREKLIRILKHDVGRLDRLITDISNASRLDAELSRDAPRRLDLTRFLTDIVALYPAAPAVRLHAAPTGGPTCIVAGLEGPLGQVFRNLIDNARSFSPPGGAVEVRISHEHDAAENFLAVVIEDEGPGIPPENLESVFERFYTARPKGQATGGSAFGGHSGLGLSIARQIVEAHGGRIRAENRTDASGRVSGARFIVLLPEARA